MYIILGGTGHVGSAAAQALLAQKQDVTIVTHRQSAAREWELRGARAALVDVHDTENLRRVLHGGRRLFLINPPAAPATDTDAEEHATLRSILAAAADHAWETIVAESAYGARPIERAGDLGTLYDMEQGLAALGAPHSVIRAAYYFSNWDAALAGARDDGVIRSFYPADFALPMVAPADLGHFAAGLLRAPAERNGLHYVEGPREYSPGDVANAFARALGREVRVDMVPREKWIEGYEALGFSPAAAASYAAMTAVTLDDADRPRTPVRGETTLEDYIARLVRDDAAAAEKPERASSSAA